MGWEVLMLLRLLEEAGLDFKMATEKRFRGCSVGFGR